MWDILYHLTCQVLYGVSLKNLWKKVVHLDESSSRQVTQTIGLKNKSWESCQF